MDGALVVSVQLPGKFKLSADCTMKPGELVDHERTAFCPSNLISRNAGAGSVTDAQVVPIRSSSATSLAGLAELPPERKKNRSISDKSLPPFPCSARVGGGIVVVPKLAASGF